MHPHNHDHCRARVRNHHGDFGHFGSGSPFKKGMFAQGLAAHMGYRMRRGDVRNAVLRLLAEKPMHGYQMIQEISEKSQGVWSPSPGSVYPTLQLLADEGLVVSEERDGKKVFRLTDEGVAAAAGFADQPAPWQEAAGPEESGVARLRKASARLAPTIMQLAGSGSPEQIEAGLEVLNDARKKLYAILGED